MNLFAKSLVIGSLFVVGCQIPTTEVEPESPQKAETPPQDWESWAQWADQRNPVGDGRGHGPDIGSDEWAEALDYQLRITDSQGHGPDIGSEEWRRAVEQKLAAN